MTAATAIGMILGFEWRMDVTCRGLGGK